MIDPNTPFKVTQINNLDPMVRVIFTWNEDLTECTFLAMGDGADEAVDEMVAVRAHEGCPFVGWKAILS